MPAVVDAFRADKDYIEVRKIQSDILRQYEGDFESILKVKYCRESEWCGILFRCSWQKKIKILFWPDKKGARSSEFEIAIQWLLDCGLIYKVPRVNEPHMPLKSLSEYECV